MNALGNEGKRVAGTELTTLKRGGGHSLKLNWVIHIFQGGVEQFWGDYTTLCYTYLGTLKFCRPHLWSRRREVCYSVRVLPPDPHPAATPYPHVSSDPNIWSSVGKSSFII